MKLLINTFKKVLFFIFIVMLSSSCSSEYDKRLKISATTWIGYVPLFYAKEKGWLKELNIKLLNVSSLAENMYVYQAGNSDAYTGTQYEYGVLSKDFKSLKPIMMFDRSNGGDLIMSNLSLKELKDTNSSIDAYLELDSVNNIILKDFIKINRLQNKTINYINKDQAEIKQLGKRAKPTVVVTYIPYNLFLEKNGFKEIASTRENFDIVVVDAMFTTVEVYERHKTQFIELKKLIDKSIASLQDNPEEFYSVVKPYMLEMNYKEFENSLSDIVWINKKLSNQLKQKLMKSKFPLRDLVKQ